MPVNKPVLILQLRPEDDTSDSEFAALLRYGGLTAGDVRRIRIEKSGIPEISLADYSAIIVGGSPFDISTPEHEKLPIQKKIEDDFQRLLTDVVAEDFPFLGACSGCGLLGSFLGTPITRRFSETVSAVTVSLTEDGEKDPLLQDFPKSISVLLGHKEACDYVPHGSTLLVQGDRCPVQMFRVGDNVYATQFHPEGDAEGFTLRIHAYKNHGYFSPQEADELIEAIDRADTPFAQLLLKRFVDRYARQGSNE
ncbi:MAG: glutamine amidotransferase [Pseudomonadota bacterium]